MRHSAYLPLEQLVRRASRDEPRALHLDAFVLVFEFAAIFK